MPTINTTTAFAGVSNTVIESKVLEFLFNNDITALVTATINNPDTINAGTARVFTGEMLQTDTYTQKGYETAEQIEAGEIDVLLDDTREVRWKIETLDQLTFASIGQLEGLIAGSLGTSMIAERAAFLALAIVDTAIALGQYVILENADTTIDKDEIRKIFFAHTDIANTLEQTFSRTEIGTNRSQIAIVSAPKVKTRLLKDMSRASMEDSQRTGDLTSIAGIGYVTFPMFGKKIPEGTSFIKDVEIDLENIQSVIYHSGSMIAPMAGLQVNTSIDADGNPNAIAKYILNRGTALRPTLIFAILKADPTEAQMIKAYDKLKTSIMVSIKSKNFREKTLTAIDIIHQDALSNLKKGKAKPAAKPAAKPKAKPKAKKK